MRTYFLPPPSCGGKKDVEKRPNQKTGRKSKGGASSLALPLAGSANLVSTATPSYAPRKCLYDKDFVMSRIVSEKQGDNGLTLQLGKEVQP